jgi:tetratricopeptide (TPR) repeat protein
MLHLGRAIGDAPEARYPVERLATIALGTAGGAVLDARIGAAALRALERATSDACGSVELIEAHAALLLRLGDPCEAERRLNLAMGTARTRPRSCSLLAQALRAQGKLDTALSVLEGALSAAGEDADLRVERGAVLAADGDYVGAAAAWREVLKRDPVHPGAFGRAAALVSRTRDAVAAQSLIDAALAAPHASTDVLRSAVHLAFGAEGEGLARASRIRTLAERWLERAPSDATALLVLARSLATLGEQAAARSRLDAIERLAPGSPAAAEALALRLGLDAPEVELEVKSVMRAAHVAGRGDLADVAARARRLATLHGSWPAWLAAAVAERRLENWSAARRALEAGLETAPGAARLQFELAAVLLELDDAPGAVVRARTGIELEGPSVAGLRLLGRALADVRRMPEALAAVRSALALAPQDAESQALLQRLRHEPGAGWRLAIGRRLKLWFSR